MPKGNKQSSDHAKSSQSSFDRAQAKLGVKPVMTINKIFDPQIVQDRMFKKKPKAAKPMPKAQDLMPANKPPVKPTPSRPKWSAGMVGNFPGYAVNMAVDALRKKK